MFFFFFQAEDGIRDLVRSRGLGDVYKRQGLEILRAVADEFGLLVISEVLGVEHLPLVAEYADVLQIGSRNMQHYPLLLSLIHI